MSGRRGACGNDRQKVGKGENDLTGDKKGGGNDN